MAIGLLFRRSEVLVRVTFLSGSIGANNPKVAAATLSAVDLAVVVAPVQTPVRFKATCSC